MENRYAHSKALSAAYFHFNYWCLFQSIIFVDDLALPARDNYGSQPPIELLRLINVKPHSISLFLRIISALLFSRQWINHGYWSDLKDTSKIELVDLVSN